MYCNSIAQARLVSDAAQAVRLLQLVQDPRYSTFVVGEVQVGRGRQGEGVSAKLESASPLPSMAAYGVPRICHHNVGFVFSRVEMWEQAAT